MALKTNDIMNLEISSDTQLLKGSTMLGLGETKHIQKCFHIWFLKEVGNMKDFVLLIVVLATFIYGYFLMGKLDKFLNTQTMSWTGSIDIAVHSINTIEKPARVIWQNDINCMKGLFVEKLCDFSERFLLSATHPNGKKEEKVV